MWRVATFSLLGATLVSSATAYRARPLPFTLPADNAKAITVAGAELAARAYDDAAEAREDFGFDITGAGLLPVEVVFDNRGATSLWTDSGQTFLEDSSGKLWDPLEPWLLEKRVTRWVATGEALRQGALGAAAGTAAGAIVGAASGVIKGESVGESLGRGAAAGAAAGAVLGGAKGAMGAEAARQRVLDDLRSKSLSEKTIEPESLGHGFIWFPAEAGQAQRLRLRLLDSAGAAHLVELRL